MFRFHHVPIRSSCELSDWFRSLIPDRLPFQLLSELLYLVFDHWASSGLASIRRYIVINEDVRFFWIIHMVWWRVLHSGWTSFGRVKLTYGTEISKHILRCYVHSYSTFIYYIHILHSYSTFIYYIHIVYSYTTFIYYIYILHSYNNNNNNKYLYSAFLLNNSKCCFDIVYPYSIFTYVHSYSIFI